MFFVHFQTFFLKFRREITEKGLKWTKKVENGLNKYFDQLSGAGSTRKLIKIHNSLKRPKKKLLESPYFGILNAKNGV